MPPIFTGNFVGTNGTNLSTRGYTVTQSSGSAEIQSNEGRLRYSSGGWVIIEPTGITVTDVDQLVQVRADSTTTGSGFYIIARGYAFYFSSNWRELEVYRTDTWAMIFSQANFLPAVPTSNTSIRVQVEGTALRAKSWTGGTEPGSWGWTGTNSALSSPTGTEIAAESWSGSATRDWFVTAHEVTNLASVPVPEASFSLPVDVSVSATGDTPPAPVPEAGFALGVDVGVGVVAAPPFVWPFDADFDHVDDTDLTDLGYTVAVFGAGSATVQDGRAVLDADDESMVRVVPPHPSTDTTDMLVRLRTPVSNAISYLGVRVDPVTGTGYEVTISGRSGPPLLLRRHSNWTWTTGTTLDSTSPTWSPGDEIYVRFQGDGDTLRVRAWAVADPEPSEWDLEATDATYTDGVTAIVHSTDEADASDIEIAEWWVNNQIVAPIPTATFTLPVGVGLDAAATVPPATVPTAGFALAVDVGLDATGNTPTATVPQAEFGIVVDVGLTGSADSPPATIPEASFTLGVDLGVLATAHTPTATVPQAGFSLATTISLDATADTPPATIPNATFAVPVEVGLAATGNMPTAGVPEASFSLAVDLGLDAVADQPDGIPKATFTLPIDVALGAVGHMPPATIPTTGFTLAVDVGLAADAQQPTPGVPTAGFALPIGVGLSATGDTPTPTTPEATFALAVDLGLAATATQPDVPVPTAGFALAVAIGLHTTGHQPAATVPTVQFAVAVLVALHATGRHPTQGDPYPIHIDGCHLPVAVTGRATTHKVTTTTRRTLPGRL